MSRILYSFILYLLSPFIILNLVLRGFKSSTYFSRWSERFGYINFDSKREVIWIHAVSVGEVMASVPLVEYFLNQSKKYQIIITTTTPTGSDQVKKCFGRDVEHCYIPYDFIGSVTRFIKQVNPRALILMETELWPNIINYCKKNNIKIVLANARMSQRSFDSYNFFSWVVLPMFKSIDLIAAQYKEDADRFKELGTPTEKIILTGNLKFDASVTNSERLKAKRILKEMAPKNVLIAASTHQNEEAIILKIYRNLKKEFPDLKLIVVPRHPERFEAVAQLFESSNFIVKRRSLSKSFSNADIILGDTMGELKYLYGVCDIAFVGGSLVETGGHNTIEPAAWKIPVLVGPHSFNFSSVNKILSEVGGLKICKNPFELESELGRLLRDNEYRLSTGASASRALEKSSGALKLLTNGISQII